MKSKIVSLFFALVLLVSTTGATAQYLHYSKTVPVQNAGGPIDVFRLHRQGAGITLMWSSGTPSDVECFEIQRSYDGEFFDTIADVGCENNSRFRYTDSDVYPGFIHYRLAAVLKTGEKVYSSVEVIRIVSRK